MVAVAEHLRAEVDHLRAEAEFKARRPRGTGMDEADVELMAWVASLVVQRHADDRHHVHEYVTVVCRMPRSARRALLAAIEDFTETHVVDFGERTPEQTAASADRIARVVLQNGGDQALADAFVLDHAIWARRHLGPDDRPWRVLQLIKGDDAALELVAQLAEALAERSAKDVAL